MSVSLKDNEKPSTSKQDLIPTPFKRVLLWPEPKESLELKRRKEKLPAVVTSPQMLEYYKKKEMIKIDAEKLNSDEEMSVRGSDDSMWDEKSDGEEELTKIASLKDVREGDFVLVEFKGGKRMVSNFVYLCIIQRIMSSNDIEIMGLNKK
ncbi:hypothetical protein FQA39_LY05181 [Lamprigera yunnana]|nr:hypothetical protein FQA39_LY05181 [Lamprigera yunnana]